RPGSELTPVRVFFATSSLISAAREGAIKPNVDCRSGDRIGLVRQWNELDLVAGDLAKHAFFPLLLGLLDALAPRGDKVPPDMARAVERGAADNGDAARADGLDGDPVAGAENQHLAGLETIAGDIDLART